MKDSLTIPEVAIGPRIQEVFERKNMKLSDFADDLGTVRQNVYRIFKKKDLDTGLLIKVSEVLNHNFFQYYKTHSNEPGDVPAEVLQELDLARKEIDYLKKIIQLMEEKARLLQVVQGNSTLGPEQDAGQNENKVTNKTITLF